MSQYIFLITFLLSSGLNYSATFRIQILEKPVKNGDIQRIVLYHDVHKASSLDEYQADKVFENFDTISSPKLLGVEACSSVSSKFSKLFVRTSKLICHYIADPESAFKDVYMNERDLQYMRDMCRKVNHPELWIDQGWLAKIEHYLNNSTIVNVQKERLFFEEFEWAAALNSILQVGKDVKLPKKKCLKKIRKVLKPFNVSVSSYIESAMTTFTNEQQRVAQLLARVQGVNTKLWLQDLSNKLSSMCEKLHSLKTLFSENYLNKKFLKEASNRANEMSSEQHSLNLLRELFGYEMQAGLLSQGPELSILESLFSKNSPLTIWSAMGGNHAKRLTPLLFEEGYSLIYDTLTRISDGNNHVILNAELSDYKNPEFLHYVLALEHEFDDVLKPAEDCKKRYEYFWSQAVDLNQLRERNLVSSSSGRV